MGKGKGKGKSKGKINKNTTNAKDLKVNYILVGSFSRF